MGKKNYQPDFPVVYAPESGLSFENQNEAMD